MIRILGFTASINVRKALWAAAEAGVEVGLEHWGGDGRPTADPEFRALNPMGLTPVLVDGALILRESNTIVRYLAARAGRTDLLPTDAAARARVEQWMDWQATDLNSSWRPAFHALVRGHKATPEAIAQSVAGWNRLIGLLDQHLATSRHVAGDTFTVADICVGLAVHRWLGTPLEHPAFANVARYADLVRARPAFIAQGLPGGP